MRRLLTPVLLATLAGCSTIPSDGPSGRSIDRSSGATSANLTYQVVDLNYALSERLKTAPVIETGSLAALQNSSTADSINIGDTLQVSIYDPSGSLFSTRAGSGSAGVQGGSQTLPNLIVDRDGSVAVPYGGLVRVAGLTTRDAAAAVRSSLRGKVANPQVIVSVAGSPANGIVVLGEVRNPGRASVIPGAENLLDAIAAAGGPNRNIDDIVVNVNRAGDTYQAPLRKVLSDFDQNVRLRRGDQVNLVYQPRRYSSFGALARVTQIEMPSGVLTLTGALGQLGGLDTTTANSRSVLVFRYERPEVAQIAGVNLPATPKGVPVIYRLNLADPTGFFIANNFVIQPDDVIFVPRADTAELRKFFEFVRSVTSIIYDVSVTSTLTNN